jgi:hypothetical protein
MKNQLCLLFCFIFFLAIQSHAQMITGVWKGKVGGNLKSTKLELKLVQKGDSLLGTSYYYESANNYRRYSVKGYFNRETNEVIWWDDELLEEMIPRTRVLSPGEIPLLIEADFNCPGDGSMKLEGKAVTKEEQKQKGLLNLEKTEQPLFTDEWTFVIDNYTVGANDPDIIDSVARISSTPNTAVPPIVPQPQPELIVQNPKKEEQPVVKETPTIVKDTTAAIVKAETKPVIKKETPPAFAAKPPVIEEKFIQRKKVLTTELPLEGDTVEIHFYDNAEIDGDSISLFMNNQLVFEHVRLSDKPYVIKFAVKDLSETNELVMVAENLGSIPPNTSYMIAYINKQRYTANLASTENSSAMIRFVRKQ